MLLLWMLYQSYAPRILRREEGQGLVEYGLIISFVAILIIASLVAMKEQLMTAYSNIVTGMQGVS